MTTPSPTGLRILIVEDDENIRRTLIDLLGMFHHNVIAVADGESALARLQEEPFDLMITDLGLPGMTGWELAGAAQQHQNGMSILAISSWQGSEAEQKMKKCGISAVIWKPFRFNQIQDAISRLSCSSRPEAPTNP